jgi:hypothetical protein
MECIEMIFQDPGIKYGMTGEKLIGEDVNKVIMV